MTKAPEYLQLYVYQRLNASFVYSLTALNPFIQSYTDGRFPDEHGSQLPQKAASLASMPVKHIVLN